MSGIEKFIRVRVWRGDQTGGALQQYKVPVRTSQTVLDVVSWIQRKLDPSLSYRFACRVGMCGSCAMMVNGQPRWTCRSHVSEVIKGDTLTIEPLRNLPVVKDLCCDMAPFFKKWNKAKGHFVSTRSRDLPLEKISPQSKPRRQADLGIECINCAVCYAACDVVAQQPAYLGPAALGRAWTLVNDCRDGARLERLQAVSLAGGCQYCHSQQGCSHHCPKSLSPARAIAGLKRTVVLEKLKGAI